MKKIMIALSIVTAMAGQAQILNVTSIEPLNLNQEKDQVAQAVAISPQGDYLLLSSDTKQGLVKLDLATRAASTITNDQGAGSEVSISNDGQMVVYSEMSFKNKRRHQAVKSIDLASGKKQTLVKASRHQQGFTLENGTAATVTDGKMKVHALKKGAAKSVERPVLSRYHLKLYITRNGQTTQLAPNGADERYIWASLSPDGKRVAFFAAGKGIVIIDLRGQMLAMLGNYEMPCWYNNDYLVAQNAKDDGHQFTSSQILLLKADGTFKAELTKPASMTMQPTCGGGRIVYTTIDGLLYEMMINIHE